MNRVIALASIVVTVAYALRPEPRAVLLGAAEKKVEFDTVAQSATIHAVLRNNTRDTTWFKGCLGVPVFRIERHVAGHWLAAGDFPCPMPKAYRAMPLRRGASVSIPLRLRSPGEYRLTAAWGWRSDLSYFQRRSTSIAFEVRAP